MKKSDDLKYELKEDRVVNRATGQSIPEEEPIMIFRAKDRKALSALENYAAACENRVHRRGVERKIAEFIKFAAKHPDRMKEPDT